MPGRTAADDTQPDFQTHARRQPRDRHAEAARYRLAIYFLARVDAEGNGADLAGLPRSSSARVNSTCRGIPKRS